MDIAVACRSEKAAPRLICGGVPMGSDAVIFWFRSDLRVGDNLALAEACASAGRLLPVYCHDPAADAPTRWG